MELKSILNCPNCGYNLNGLPEDRCPECGQDFDPRELQARQVARELTRREWRLILFQLVGFTVGFSILNLLALFIGPTTNKTAELLTNIVLAVFIAGAVVNSLTLAKRFDTIRTKTRHGRKEKMGLRFQILSTLALFVVHFFLFGLVAFIIIIVGISTGLLPES